MACCKPVYSATLPPKIGKLLAVAMRTMSKVAPEAMTVMVSIAKYVLTRYAVSRIPLGYHELASSLCDARSVEAIVREEFGWLA